MSRAPLVLVVDDEPAILDLVEHGLRHVGLRVARAESASEGLARFAALGDDLDLLVLDRDLPDGTGDAVLRTVRTTWDGPVIMQSGWPGEDAPADPRTHHLDKPWSLRDFVETVQRMLDPGR